MGMARFEARDDVLSGQLTIAQIALVCVLGYADFLCRLRLAQGLSETRRLPSEDAGTAVGENLAAAAGVTGRTAP
jgi:hypothetical protein